MPRICTICRHPQITAINAALARPGGSQRQVADSFGLNQKTLWRHATLCVARSVSKALEKQEVISGARMITEVSGVRSRFDSAMTQTYESGDFRTLSPLGNVYLKATETIARLAGLEGFRPASSTTQVAIDARGAQFLIAPQQPAVEPTSTAEADGNGKDDAPDRRGEG